MRGLRRAFWKIPKPAVCVPALVGRLRKCGAVLQVSDLLDGGLKYEGEWKPCKERFVKKLLSPVPGNVKQPSLRCGP